MSAPVSVPDATDETPGVEETSADAPWRAKRRNRPILPLKYGDVGLPVHQALREVLALGSNKNTYGPVEGTAELRQAAAGYWARRGLATDPHLVIAAPGSKSLMYSVLLALGGDVVVPTPSWVGYGSQNQLAHHRTVRVPAAAGHGGVPQPGLLASLVAQARSDGRDVRAVVVTNPDNPTGTVPSKATVRQLADTARELDLVIISHEVYRDLVHDPLTFVHSPAEFAPERTVVVTGLSKSLAIGGWRVGVARLPDGSRGHSLRTDVLDIAREIWSCTPVPIQHAAAYAFNEPVEITERIERSRRLHGAVARAVAARLIAAGASVPTPRAAFYVYPDFSAWAPHLADVHSITTGPELADFLLVRHGLGSLPAAKFEGGHNGLRLRLATSLLYGDTDVQRYAALASDDPTALPWIRTHLDRLGTILSEIAPPGFTS